MQILYINHYAGSIYHGMEYRPYYLAKQWVKLGHKVTIVASGYSHLRQQNIIIDRQENYLTETIDGINYIWCKTPTYKINGFKRLINIFVFLKRLYCLMPKLIDQVKPNLVIASSTYPFDTLIAAKIAKKARAKFIYEVHDLWPLTPIELGGMSKYHPFIMLMQKAEDFGYRYADQIVSLLPKASNYMQEHGMIPTKFNYIPNGVCVTTWQSNNKGLPLEHQLKINELKKQPKFLIGYAGGMGKSNALDFLLNAAALLEIDANKSFLVKKPVFILVGSGSNKEHLIKRLENEKIHNVLILPEINKMQVPAFLAEMDALYIGWNNLPIYRFGISPNKIFDYMLAAKPIIHSVTAGNDIVQEAGCGLSVMAEDSLKIAYAVEKLIKMDQLEREQLGRNGYDYVLNNHNYCILAKQFFNIYEKIKND